MAIDKQQNVAVRPEKGARALFLIETPFQLLCAYEIIAEYAPNYTLVLRLTEMGRGDEQLIQAAKTLGLTYRTVTVRVGHHYRDMVTSGLSLLPTLLPKYDDVYLGSYFSRFIMSLRLGLRSTNFWLLDDGLATLHSQQLMAAKDQPPFNLATFFRVPALPDQSVIYHDFARLAAVNTVTYSDDALFIGQPARGLTTNAISKGQIPHLAYHQIIETCRQLSPGRMIYVPHRLERPEFVQSLSEKFDLDVEYTTICVELHFVKSGVIPRQVYTPISTAAFTFAKMFPECTVSIFPSVVVHLPHAAATLAYASEHPNMRILDMQVEAASDEAA